MPWTSTSPISSDEPLRSVSSGLCRRRQRGRRGERESDGPLRLGQGLLFAEPARERSAPIVCEFARRWLSAVVWARIRFGTCSPILNGIGFDKFQALHPLLVGHQATWRGFYSRNGQTSSSLTGRTSGLPIELRARFRLRTSASAWVGRTTPCSIPRRRLTATRERLASSAWEIPAMIL
jgi:hypothetical protein